MRSTLLLVPALLLAGESSAEIIQIEVTIENLAPANGTFQTPFWVGVHDGGFDLYNMGEAISPELERLAEDGTIGPIAGLFDDTANGSAQGVVAPGGPFAPGDIASLTLEIDTADPAARYFSYASMVIPSNDAFVANGSPTAHEIVTAGGMFIGTDFFIAGSAVLDAGSEVNDEVAENTAFLGQSEPDTGVVEGGVVQAHPGFLGSSGNPGPLGNILGTPQFAGGDFSLQDYPIARVTVTPAPGALALLGLAGLASRRRRRARS